MVDHHESMVNECSVFFLGPPLRSDSRHIVIGLALLL